MRSFFSKLGSSPSGKKSGPSDAEVQGQLAEAQEALQKLRQTQQENFPLLNESTRLVQALEGAVARMPEGDMRGVWREQLVELQRGLQQATERMLSRGAKPAAAPAPTIFEGLNMDGPGAASGSASEPVIASDLSNLGGDMFSGLTVGGLDLGGPSEQSSIVPELAAIEEKPGLSAADSKLPQGVGSIPLPEDLFSGLDDLSLSSTHAADPFQIASPPTNPAGDIPQSEAQTASPATALASTPPAPPANSNGMRAVHAAPPAPITELSLPGGDGKRKKKITRRLGYAREGGAAKPVDAKLPDSIAQRPVSATSLASTPSFNGSLLEPEPLEAGTSVTSTSTSKPISPLERASSATSLAIKQSRGVQEGGKLPEESSQDDQLAAFGASLDPQSSIKETDILVRQEEQPGEETHPFAGGLSRAASPVLAQHNLVNSEAATTISGFEAEMASVRHAAEARLEQGLVAASAQEQAAKQRRRKLRAQLSRQTGELYRLRLAEAEAVDSEEFDAAASLSSQSDEVQQRLNRLQEESRAAEQAVQNAVAARWKSAKQQAGVWRESAKKLRELSAQHEKDAQSLTTRAAQLASQAEKMRATASERCEELLKRISARRRWLLEEQESLGRKIEEAVRPVSGVRDEQAATVETLQHEVAALRAALAEKESALEAAQQELQRSQEQVAALTGKFDKSIARLEDDRRALEAEEADQAREESSLQADEQRIAAAQAEALVKEQKLQEQARKAKQEADEILQRAADLESASATGESSWAKLNSQRGELEAAETFLQSVRQGAEAARADIRELVANRTAVTAAANAADEVALAAKRRLPELEADKKAAAAARDFKEAARLSAEAKALLSSSEASKQEAAKLRAQVASAEAEERRALSELALKEGSLKEAEHAAALARWRHLQALLGTSRQWLEAALAADEFGEAEALQAEIDEAAQEANSLAASHAFTDADMGDLATSKQSSAAVDATDHAPPSDHDAAGTVLQATATAPSSQSDALHGESSLLPAAEMHASTSHGDPIGDMSMSSLPGNGQQDHVSRDRVSTTVSASHSGAASPSTTLHPTSRTQSGTALQSREDGLFLGLESLSQPISRQASAGILEAEGAGVSRLEGIEVASSGMTSGFGDLFGGLSMDESARSPVTNGLHLPAETTVARWSIDGPSEGPLQEASASGRTSPMSRKQSETGVSELTMHANTTDSGGYDLQSDSTACRVSMPQLDVGIKDVQNLPKGFPTILPSPTASLDSSKASARHFQESLGTSLSSELGATAAFPSLGPSVSTSKEALEEVPAVGLEDAQGGQQEIEKNSVGEDLFAGLNFT